MDPTESPASIVQQQLEAYNRRDLRSFCALFAEDVALFELGASTPTTIGLSALRVRYQALFEQSPNLYSHLISRITHGQTVIDLERITGRNGASEPIELVAIYRIAAGRISRVDFVR